MPEYRIGHHSTQLRHCSYLEDETYYLVVPHRTHRMLVAAETTIPPSKLLYDYGTNEWTVTDGVYHPEIYPTDSMNRHLMKREVTMLHDHESGYRTTVYNDAYLKSLLKELLGRIGNYSVDASCSFLNNIRQHSADLSNWQNMTAVIPMRLDDGNNILIHRCKQRLISKALHAHRPETRPCSPIHMPLSNSAGSQYAHSQTVYFGDHSDYPSMLDILDCEDVRECILESGVDMVLDCPVVNSIIFYSRDEQKIEKIYQCLEENKFINYDGSETAKPIPIGVHSTTIYSELDAINGYFEQTGAQLSIRTASETVKTYRINLSYRHNDPDGLTTVKKIGQFLSSPSCSAVVEALPRKARKAGGCEHVMSVLTKNGITLDCSKELNSQHLGPVMLENLELFEFSKADWTISIIADDMRIINFLKLLKKEHVVETVSIHHRNIPDVYRALFGNTEVTHGQASGAKK